MTKDDLIELREKFRARFETHDFCIGQVEVEKFFRELLGEPEPVEEYNPNYKSLTAKELEDAMDQVGLTSDKVKKLFDRDDTFYKLIKNKS